MSRSRNDNSASSTALIRRLAGTYLKPYTARLGLAIACMIVAAMSQPALAWLMEPVVSDVFVARDRSMLVPVALAVASVMIFGGLANFGQSLLMNWIGLRIVADLQRQVFNHIIGLDLAFFHRTPTGRLIANLINDANLVRQATSQTLTGLIKEALTVIFLVGLMFYQDWQLAMIVFFVFPLAYWPISRLGRRMRKVTVNTQAEIGDFTSLLNETFQGARHVKAYGMEAYESERAKSVIDRLFRLYMKAAKTRGVLSPIMEALGGLAISLVIFYGGQQVIDGTLEAGAFFAFVTALAFAYRPLKSVASLNTVLQEGLAASQRVFAVLDEKPQIVDRDDAKNLALKGGSVDFESVSFAYGDKAPALNDVTLDVPAAKTVALVGPSGAGKSTLLNLIARFFEVESGRVSIDGQDVRDVTLASLRGAIGLVSQEITLFNDTVHANIAYGAPGGTASKEDVEGVARAAAAHAFIAELPNGYQTIVGERGVTLSGGQRQRIAIARAMLKNAPILLLDEATASLDTESERQVQAALDRLKEGRTTIVIAHRLSTVRDADVIYVIENGAVVEHGRHADLYDAGGLYTRLYDLQFGIDGVTADAP
jgi:subfamily B ATP-binding cassette protein MsbA